MESESKCPGCLKLLNGTAELACGHTFCRSCVEKIKELTENPNGERAPLCLVCRVPFEAEATLPASKYYDRIAQRHNPDAPKICEDCQMNQAFFFCSSACGLLCETCYSLHSQHPSKKLHNAMSMLLYEGSMGFDPAKCIMHNSPIIAVCITCWPNTELCTNCAWDHSRSKTGHQIKELAKITNSSGQQDSLHIHIKERITTLNRIRQESIEAIEKASAQETNDIQLIRQTYDDAIKKMEELRQRDIKKAEEKASQLCRPHKDTISLCDMMKNVMEYSIQISQESVRTSKDKQIDSKLFKTDRFMEQLLNSPIEDVVYTKPMILEPYVFWPIKISMDHSMTLDSYSKVVRDAVNQDSQNHASEDVHMLRDQLNALSDQLLIANQTIRELSQIQNTSDDEADRRSFLNESEDDMEGEGEGEDFEFENSQILHPENFRFLSKTLDSNSGEPLINFPWAIAVNPQNGHLYVTEQHKHRIVVLDEDLSFVQNFGMEGAGPGQLSEPLGIAISTKGLIAVSEKSGNRVQVFCQSFQMITEIKAGQAKSSSCRQKASYDGFSGPKALCFDRKDNLYVCNNQKNRVDKFNRLFEFECSFANETDGSEVPSPDGICCTSSGEICVVGTSSSELKFFDTNGVFLRMVPITSICGFVSIAKGPQNSIFVSDRAAHRIFVIGEHGHRVHVIGGQGSQDGKFDAQKGICFGPNGHMYVCDYGNHRIQVFADY